MAIKNQMPLSYINYKIRAFITIIIIGEIMVKGKIKLRQDNS